MSTLQAFKIITDSGKISTSKVIEKLSSQDGSFSQRLWTTLPTLNQSNSSFYNETEKDFSVQFSSASRPTVQSEMFSAASLQRLNSSGSETFPADESKSTGSRESHSISTYLLSISSSTIGTNTRIQQGQDLSHTKTVEFSKTIFNDTSYLPATDPTKISSSRNLSWDINKTASTDSGFDSSSAQNANETSLVDQGRLTAEISETSSASLSRSESGNNSWVSGVSDMPISLYSTVNELHALRNLSGSTTTFEHGNSSAIQFWSLFVTGAEGSSLHHSFPSNVTESWRDTFDQKSSSPALETVEPPGRSSDVVESMSTSLARSPTERPGRTQTLTSETSPPITINPVNPNKDRSDTDLVTTSKPIDAETVC